MLSLRKLAASLTENDQGLYRSGLEEFDRLGIRFSPGQLIIAGARPGVGKTSFFLFLYKNLCESNGIPQLFISLEEPETLLYKKLAATVSGIPVEDLQKNAGSIIMDNLDTLFADSCFIVLESPAWEKIKEKISQAAIEGIKIIFLDKLQTIHSGDPHHNRDQELGGITQELKGLAMSNQLLIFASSSLSRGVEYREGKSPYLSDLRESGMIEENADTVLLISRPEVYGILEDEYGNSLKNYMEVKVAKNRNGLTGTMKFTFLGRIPAVSEFSGYENREFLDRFNRSESSPDTPF